jgi:hypothetical protein
MPFWKSDRPTLKIFPGYPKHQASNSPFSGDSQNLTLGIRLLSHHATVDANRPESRDDGL